MPDKSRRVYMSSTLERRHACVRAYLSMLCFAATTAYAGGADKVAQSVRDEIALGRVQHVFVSIDDGGLRRGWLKDGDRCWADSANTREENALCAGQVDAAYKTALTTLKAKIIARHPRLKLDGELELGPEVLAAVSDENMLNELLSDPAIVSITLNNVMRP